MKNFALMSVMALSAFGAAQAYAEAVPGKAAPEFEIMDANGKVQKLSNYKDKWVVLEWFNKDCPFVKKHYGSKNMQGLQKNYTGKGVVWLTVNSSAKGQQGFELPGAALKTASSLDASPTAILQDPEGTMGKAYGAKTTPHMFVINPAGTVIYAGAIDSDDSSDPAVIAKSTNYVAAALDASLSLPAKPVTVAYHKPYGCGVKYK